MPELPEVRAHAERIGREFAGAEVAELRALSFTALKTADPPAAALVGRTLDEAGQRGKYLWARFGDVHAVVHLMQGGRLRPDEKQSAKPRGGLARFRFADGRALLLTEQSKEKRAGVWLVGGDPEAGEPLSKLGPEADAVTVEDLVEMWSEHNQRLHNWLRDQRQIAGIGRRLANEVCYRARLSPFAMTGRLGEQGAASVVAAIGEAVDEGLAFERARDDMSASADRPGAVHGRAGEPCPDCDDTIRSVEYSGYTVAYCPTVQTGGKVLADNTTSRFLK